MGRLLFDAFDAGGFTDRQVARPEWDVNLGSWLPSSGVALAPMINEETPVDSTYIQSAFGVVEDTCEVSLTAMMEPHAGDVTIRLRAALV